VDGPEPEETPRARRGLGRAWLTNRGAGRSGSRLDRTPPPGLAPLANTTSHTLLHAGHKRRYLLHRPTTRHGGAAPLVVMLHGGFGWPEQAEHAYRWSDVADRFGFLVCYPEGLFRTWNAGTCCGGAMREKLDDVGFLAAVVGDVARAERVDLDRIYATGMSNGAMMSYRLAAELPGRFAAIAAVAGTMTVPLGEARPLSVLHIHGSTDRSVPFTGGVGRRAFAPDRRPSVPQTVAAWRALAGCGPVRVSQVGPVRTETAMAADGTMVELVTVVGAGHQWPGAVVVNPDVARRLQMDRPSDAFDATERIWDFFVSHPRIA
jgi:polyhydroxybutyrate depolymerase